MRETGFDCDCKTRLDCYDGLITHWDFGAAYAKAFRYWDWRVFVIAGWWLDEVHGYRDGRMRLSWILEEGGWRAVPIVGMVMAWRFVSRHKDF